MKNRNGYLGGMGREVRRFTVSAWAVWAAVMVSGPAMGAEGLGHRAFLPLDRAQKAAQAAVQKCAEDGYRVSAAVVDASGVVQVVLRADGAGPHTIQSSSKKAFTAASLGRSTGELAALIEKRPDLQGLRDMDDRILILAGGFPIMMDGETVGGIGVGGAPGGALDEACARAGLAAVGVK